MRSPSRAIQHLKSEGVSATLLRTMGYFYKKVVRPYLPTISPVKYSGVETGKFHHLGDFILPSSFIPLDAIDIPTYESALLNGLRYHACEDDRIVIVGAGRGITTVAAARQATRGSITAFEGDHDGFARSSALLRLHNLERRVDLRLAIVGENVGVYGSNYASELIHPADLPACDLLEMDCEGAELLILRTMSIRPRVILVETHGFLGSSTEEVSDQLVAIGYEIISVELAEPRQAENCDKLDIRVIVSRRLST